MCYWQPGWLLFTVLPGLRVPQDSALSVHYQITRTLQELPGQEGASYTQSTSIRKAEKQQKGSWVLFGAILLLENSQHILSFISPTREQHASSFQHTQSCPPGCTHYLHLSKKSALWHILFYTEHRSVATLPRTNMQHFRKAERVSSKENQIWEVQIPLQTVRNLDLGFKSGTRPC